MYSQSRKTRSPMHAFHRSKIVLLFTVYSFGGSNLGSKTTAFIRGIFTFFHCAGLATNLLEIYDRDFGVHERDGFVK